MAVAKFLHWLAFFYCNIYKKEKDKKEVLVSIEENILENFIKEKFRISMKKIYNYVLKEDGYGCEYRHMWVEREVL